MIFAEWAWKYGVESAKRQFRLGECLIFTVRPGKSVFAECGHWKTSVPLWGRSITEAKQEIRKQILNQHMSEKYIIDFEQEKINAS